ncbi:MULTISPECIES: hypothetical protein [unclassified Azospirillum]|uniref:hypothetical protein n=1 Tax=unclassified Azospirillum TaxID=2630922 RepID=UPI000B72686D|nr:MULTISPECIES: hypothetical protein [unclassified Azospirillum]SNR94480.1 hypothetical protein SAMN05880556_101698 [Azospirillum sp. RU38E]SNS10584.1 hypothetical protein SAMN05880591_101698 [Azospirillum sp. RU37A]
MNINSLFSPSAILSRLQVKPTAGSSGTPAATTKTAAAPPDLASQQREEMAALKQERAAYDAQRNSEIQKRQQEFEQTHGRPYGQRGDPPLAFQMAMPANERGYMPFVSADQQKTIDNITDKYLQQENPAAMWVELTTLGLNSDQLVKSAKYFTTLDGHMATREEATKGVNISV